MATETAVAVEAAEYIVKGCTVHIMPDMKATDAAMEAALHEAVEKAAARLEMTATLAETAAVAMGTSANANVAPLRILHQPTAER